MTTFQIILIVIGIIIIGIPLYLFVGKGGRKIGAAIGGVFDAIFSWDSKRFEKTYDEMKDEDPMKALWLLVIIIFAAFSIIAFVVRLGWLAYLGIKAGVKFYWKSLKYCWE